MSEWLTKQLEKIDPMILYGIFIVFRSIWYAIDFLCDTLTGYSPINGSREEREKAAKNYEHSAQLVTIWGRGNHYFVDRHMRSNFGYTHVKYMDPREILKVGEEHFNLLEENIQ